MRSDLAREARLGTLRLVRLVAIIVLLGGPLSVAQPSEGARSGSDSASGALTPRALLENVRSHHPALRAAQAELRAASGEFMAISGAFDPQWRSSALWDQGGFYENRILETSVVQPLSTWGVTGFAGWRQGQGGFPAYEGKSVTGSAGEVRLGFEVPLLRDREIDRRRASQEQASQGVESQKAALRQTELDTFSAALQRYWRWVFAARAVEVQLVLLRVAKERDAWLARRVAAGDLPEFERQDSLRSVIQRESQRIAAERAFEQASFDLSQYWRDEQGRMRVPAREHVPAWDPRRGPIRSASLSEGDEAAWIEKAWSNRPELKRIEYSVRQAETEVALQRNQALPRVDVRISASQDLGQTDPTRSQRELEASVGIEIPLLNRTPKGRATSAVAQEARLAQQSALLRDRIRAEVLDASSQLRAAEERLNLARKEVELNRLLEQGERRRFEQGDGTVFLLNLREQATADSELREWEAWVDRERGRGILELTTGREPLFDLSE